MPSPTCPKCAAAMAPGFLIDKGTPGGGGASAPEWAGGAPEVSFWTGLQLRGRERHPVTTFRCPACGYLESYATPA